MFPQKFLLHDYSLTAKEGFGRLVQCHYNLITMCKEVPFEKVVQNLLGVPTCPIMFFK